MDIDADVLAARAAREADAGDHLAAARHYDQLADASTGTSQTGFRLDAAEQWYRAGRLDRAQAARKAVGEPKTPVLIQRATLMDARLATAAGQADVALSLIGGLGRPASSDLAADTLAAKSEALFKLGEVSEAVLALIEREIWLSHAAAIDDNYARIWAGMNAARMDGYALSVPEEADTTLSGWLLLGQIGAESERNPFVFKSRLIEWRHQYPFHPATGDFVDALLGDYRAQLKFPHQVALLLPLTGRQRNSAIAVRDGFLAARFEHQDTETAPSVRVYNTGRYGAADAYRRALFDGADFIVGPLTKSEVAAVAKVSRGHIPTLALNFLPPEQVTNPGFFQFSLSPEDEARQAAKRIVADGYTRGVALVPDNGWGLRQLESFAESLRESGGTLLAFKAYDPDSRDVSSSIADLLHVTMSNARQRQLAAELGTQLEYNPRQRKDAEFVFLAALPKQGRMIKPLLEFHYAPNPTAPTYATSAIFEQSNSNADLNGVIFNDMPWVLTPDPTAEYLRRIIARYWPSRADRRARLYAMGFDAYRLVPLLHTGEIGPDRPVPGMTGVLAADEHRRIYRQLTWARFERGRPVVIASRAIRANTPIDGQ
ncbi:MAG: penicillin-binding protein activator [Gammaproteobacteria bacterium]